MPKSQLNTSSENASLEVKDDVVAILEANEVEKRDGKSTVYKNFDAHKEGLISCRFSLATTENNNTSWHNVIAWGKLAEVIHHYMEKGDKLYVRGRIQYYKYKALF